MIDKEFIANFSSTYADVRKLDAKKINLKGKNILEYMEQNKTVVKHAQDTRETVTNNDLWGTYAEVVDGEVILHDEYFDSPARQGLGIRKVIDNKTYLNDDSFYSNIETNKITKGFYTFYQCDLSEFSSDLSNLEEGMGMFSECFRLASFDSNLSELRNGENMFYFNTHLTTFSIDLPQLKNGERMFYYNTQLTQFSSDLSELVNGTHMFGYCENMTKFETNLSSLIDANGMFQYCRNLQQVGFENYLYGYSVDMAQFSCDLSSLVMGFSMFEGCSKLQNFSTCLQNLHEGNSMFRNCINITNFDASLENLRGGDNMFDYCLTLSEFSSNLDKLVSGDFMFNSCRELSNFDINMPKLEKGRNMFSGCSNLTTFTSDLSSLTDGYQMFLSCFNLTTFTSDLSSLRRGDKMFWGCSLDAKSLMYIAYSINDVTNLSTNESDKKIGIGLNYDLYGTAGSTFSKLPDDVREYLNQIHSKGWTINITYNQYMDAGTYQPTSLIPIDGQEMNTPIAYYAKPVPADEETARYINSNGEYYNIDGGNIIIGDDISTYGLFTCEEEAAMNMGLVRYERPIIRKTDEKLEKTKEWYRNMQESNANGNQPSLF